MAELLCSTVLWWCGVLSVFVPFPLKQGGLKVVVPFGDSNCVSNRVYE